MSIKRVFEVALVIGIVAGVFAFGGTTASFAVEDRRTSAAAVAALKQMNKNMTTAAIALEAATAAAETVQPLLDSRVAETSADESLSTTPQRIDCGKSASPRSWKCIDTAAGGVTVYRGDADVTSSTGFPESADTAFGGDSVAYLVLASSTLTVRCVCGE